MAEQPRIVSSTPQEQAESARQFAIELARVAAESRSEDVVVIDLRGLSGVADFFVIGTGSSDRQMNAVLGRIAEFARANGRRPMSVGGADAANWILADYVDVVVHLFDAAHRAYYDLDGLWGDAPRVEWLAESADKPHLHTDED